MIYLIVFIAAVAFALRGLSEAITMIQPQDKMFATNQYGEGARGHKLFKYYHAIDGGKDALLIALGMLFMFTTSWEQVALAFAVGWSVYELFYVYGRYGTFVNPAPEHVTMFDLFHWYVPAWVMHLVRLVLVCGLIWRIV